MREFFQLQSSVSFSGVPGVFKFGASVIVLSEGILGSLLLVGCFSELVRGRVGLHKVFGLRAGVPDLASVGGGGCELVGGRGGIPELVDGGGGVLQSVGGESGVHQLDGGGGGLHELIGGKGSILDLASGRGILPDLVRRKENSLKLG